jgi:hypothetical protein
LTSVNLGVLRMSRVLLYASDDKLKAIDGPPGWLERLDLGLTVGPPGVAVTTTLPPRDTQALQVMIDKADRRIRKEGKARALTDSIAGRPPQLFTFEGPSGRLADSGVLWFAGAGDGVGFLLVGSITNAIAQVQEQPGALASADPVNTVQRFFESRFEPRADSGQDSRMAAWVWWTVESSTARAGGLAAAPWVAGIALYAGRIDIDPSSEWPENSDTAAIQNLVIGSPIWVEQV